MASLNVNLDGMRQSQSLILDAVRTKTNNDRSFDMATPPTVNPQSSMTETRSGINEGKHVSLSLDGSISEKTQKIALSGEFINLSDFMPLNNMPDSSELETVVSQSGSMYVRPRKSRRAIDSFMSWLSAWSNYEAYLIAHKPRTQDHIMRQWLFWPNYGTLVICLVLTHCVVSPRWFRSRWLVTVFCP